MAGRSSIRSYALLVALASFVGAASAAETTDEASSSLSEIVITAQRRSESVQQVPVSVTVVSSEELTRQGVQTIQDLGKMSASLEFQPVTAGAPGGGGFVRGIGTQTVGGVTSTGSVSVVLDGVVLGNTHVTDVFDLNRVEVLKGPQGTLFGSSVSAGVISLTTNAPDPTKLVTTLSAEYGSGDLGSQYMRRTLRGTTNLPINDNSALRLSFHADENDDVYSNPYLGSTSQNSDIGARARYMIHFTENVTLNIIGDYNRNHLSGNPVLTVRYAPPGSALANTLADCGVTPSDTNRSFCSQISTFYELLDRGISAQIDWNLHDIGTLTSISSVRKGTSSNRTDITGLPLASAETNFALGNPCLFFNCVPIFAILPGGENGEQSQNRTLMTEELRLASNLGSKFDWVAGLYYQHYKLIDLEPGITIADFTGAGPATIDSSFTNHVHTQDYAVFGNLTYHLTDGISLIGGARWTHSDVSQDKYDPPDTGTTQVYSLSTSASKPSWRVGVQDQLSRSTMIYGTVSTGYKAPEISDLLQNGGHLYVVRPELPTNYELGIKQSILDDRLAIDAAVFYETVKDYQGQNCAVNASGTFACAASSVPRVNSKGIELDIFGKPWMGMSVNMSGILNPATYPAHYLGSDGTDLGGRQLNYASKTKVTVSAEQSLPVTSVYSAVLGADATYRSAQSEFPSALPALTAPASTQVNVRVGIRSPNWAAYVFSRNVGAKPDPRQLYPTPFQTGGIWQVLDQNSLRLVGLQFEGKF